MPYTDVEWANQDTVTETKLDTMMGNLDFLRAEQIVERLIVRPQLSFGCQVQIPEPDSPATCRGKIDIGGIITAYTNTWTEPWSGYYPHTWSSASLASQSLAALVPGDTHIVSLHIDVDLGSGYVSYPWMHAWYRHTTERESGSLAWAFDIKQPTAPGGAYEWNVQAQSPAGAALFFRKHRLFVKRAATFSL